MTSPFRWRRLLSPRSPVRSSAECPQPSVTMSNALAEVPQAPAINIEAVVKRYRLHRKPLYRFLDLFGLCPSGGGYFSEHTALRDVTLTVRRGEKVAIIGRNGAGKSTLLKVVTG